MVTPERGVRVLQTSVHDLEDFYRAGILDHASIAAEFLDKDRYDRPGGRLEFVPARELDERRHREGRAVADQVSFHGAALPPMTVGTPKAVGDVQPRDGRQRIARLE